MGRRVWEGRIGDTMESKADKVIDMALGVLFGLGLLAMMFNLVISLGGN